MLQFHEWTMWLRKEHVVEESEEENGNEMASRESVEDEYDYKVNPKN